jgi:dCTP deaminase
MILSDIDILKNIKEGRIKITPFNKKHIQPSTLDLTLSNKIRVFDNYDVEVVDVKNPKDVSRLIEVKKNGHFIIHPGEFILGASVEVVSLPSDVAAIVEGRSSMGRLGLIVHATAGYIDPGFSGAITLEMSNLSKFPIKLYEGMRVAQLAFFKMSSPVKNLYGSEKLRSKYQGQIEPTTSRIEKDFEK